MIGVLIGAIAITGGMAVIGQIEKAKVDNEVRELARLKKKTVSLAAQRGTLNGVTLQQLVELDFFRSESVSGPVGARVVRNQWGGTITAAVTSFPTLDDSIRYFYTGVSTAACKQLGMQAGAVAAGIIVQGTIVKSTVLASGSNNVNQQALIANCDQGANNVSIDFILSK